MNNEIPNIGDTAPYFSGFSVNGNEISLENIFENGQNILMVFYRGHW